MSSSRRISRSAWISLGVGSLLVIGGVWLVVAGFSEATEAQVTMLDAASVLFALAVAVPVAQMTWETGALRSGGRPAKIAYTVGAVLVLAGAGLYTAGFVSGGQQFMTLAATLTFAGLGCAFLYLAWRALQREPLLRGARLEPLPDEDDDDVVKPATPWGISEDPFEPDPRPDADDGPATPDGPPTRSV